MTYETIKMEISANPEYVSIIRLTTSGIANKVGFCLDDIEDLKVAISEACTNAIKHSLEDRFTIIYTIYPYRYICKCIFIFILKTKGAAYATLSYVIFSQYRLPDFL